MNSVSKSTFICLFAILASLSTALGDDNEHPYISVTGTATIEVVPDEMHWLFSIETKGASPAEVAEKHDSTVSRVLDFLYSNSIEESDVQTSRIQLSENWIYRNRERIKEGYRANTTVTFDSTHLDQYRLLWIGLSELPGVSIGNVSLDASERIRYQNEARLQAVRAAKEKARAMTEELGSILEEPLAIEEDLSASEGYQRNLMRNFAAPASEQASSGPSLSPGTIEIKTRVKVTFRISTP